MITGSIGAVSTGAFRRPCRLPIRSPCMGNLIFLLVIVVVFGV